MENNFLFYVVFLLRVFFSLPIFDFHVNNCLSRLLSLLIYLICCPLYSESSSCVKLRSSVKLAIFVVVALIMFYVIHAPA